MKKKQASRNPPWNRDELILALDLYLRYSGLARGGSSIEIQELSDTLKRLNSILGGKGRKNYRNPNSVYMKLMNFRRLDPAFISKGKLGLRRGGKDDEVVWKEFSDDPERCRQVARAIRDAISSRTEDLLVTSEEEGVVEAEEGRLLTRIHRTRERNRKLVEEKKKRFAIKNGRLFCEVCGFDFEKVYGEGGKGLIECHHIRPIHTLRPGEKTRLEDLVLICPNCHRLIHSRKPWFTLKELGELPGVKELRKRHELGL